MQIQVLLFGIVADLVGESTIEMELSENTSIKNFKEELIIRFPQLKNYSTYAVAVNENYAQNDVILKEQDVLAIIPPVSGG
jgi:molybdopterin converting factor subunit 1